MTDTDCRKCGATMPLMSTMCPTCPFRDGSPTRYLANDLTISALNEASRICHSTGTNGLKGRTGKPSRLCRGARDIQIKVFYTAGVIAAPTDAAWDEAWNDLKRRKKKQ